MTFPLGILPTTRNQIHNLLHPPQLSHHSQVLEGGILKDDQFNKTFNHWSKTLSSLLVTQGLIKPELKLLIPQLLKVQFIPHMESYMRTGFDAAKEFPLVAENAFKFMDILGRIVPDYSMPKDITGRYLQGKMLAPSKDAWLKAQSL